MAVGVAQLNLPLGRFERFLERGAFEEECFHVGEVRKG